KDAGRSHLTEGSDRRGHRRDGSSSTSRVPRLVSVIRPRSYRFRYKRGRRSLLAGPLSSQNSPQGQGRGSPWRPTDGFCSTCRPPSTPLRPRARRLSSCRTGLLSFGSACPHADSRTEPTTHTWHRTAPVSLEVLIQHS